MGATKTQLPDLLGKTHEHDSRENERIDDLSQARRIRIRLSGCNVFSLLGFGTASWLMSSRKTVDSIAAAVFAGL